MIFIVAGEMSGDRIGSELMQEFHRLSPTTPIKGIGGPFMRQMGMELLYPMEELQVMGFVDVACALPHLVGLFYKTVEAIVADSPQIVVTIDYPGFNLRLAKALRKRGFRGKICHYVSPSVWVWGRKRIQLLAQYFDLLLVIFPFEPKWFAHTSLRVEFVGHPLARKISHAERYDPHLIALFPGSREKEIQRNFPFFLRLIHKIKQTFPAIRCVVSLAQEQYRKWMPGCDLVSPSEMEGLNPSIAVAKSGTICLELALREIPSVAVYSLSYPDYFFAKYLFRIKTPFYTLPNLILNRLLFPELIGPLLTDDRLFSEVKKLIVDRSLWEEFHSSCRKVRKLLAVPDGSKSPAQHILSLF